jgi:type I restriction enzyme S subunit
MATSQDFVNWVCSSAIDYQFLKYVLVAEHDTFLQFASGTTHQTIYFPEAKAFSVCLPPIEEQRAIAHILGTLDDKIELNRKRNETLEAMARALFQSWFVDFDPVRAKAEGRPTGLPADIAALFPDSFEDSELGPIPKGWRVGKIADMASLSKTSITPGKYPDEEFAHFSLPAYDEGKKPRIEAGSTIKSNKFIVPNSAVLLSKLNPSIPRVWLPDTDVQQRPICSTEFLVLAPGEECFREYLFSLVTNVEFRTQFLSLVGGTSNSHQRVKPDGLLDMQAILPPENLISEYARRARPLLNRVQSNGKESESLAALRDTLLPKLISGEIRVNGLAWVQEKRFCHA